MNEKITGASPTSGMNLRERILHVGGWETEKGTVEFGSMMAVDALVSHVLRDIATQGEPVGWQFYQGGKWWYGDDRIKDHRKNTEEAGFQVRDVYAAPQPSSEQVENWRHDAEDLEALHNNLDDAGTPRHDSSGIEYSEWGRVIQYAKAAAQAEAAEQQPALVVKLPFEFGNGMMRADQVIAAIEAAGGRVEP